MKQDDERPGRNGLSAEELAGADVLRLLGAVGFQQAVEERLRAAQDRAIDKARM